MKRYFHGKTILVTGGSGSIGSEIVRHLIKFNPKVIRVFSNDEDGQFNFQKEIGENLKVRFLLGDIRDRERLKKAMENVDIVFHAAALKHVPLCEYNPFEAVKTNVIGTQNVIEAALAEQVEKMVMISTDKATNPVSVLGSTKLLAERLTTSADYYKGRRKTTFCCVRFGNVLDSRGSVIPVFRDQIKKGGPVTVTHPDMTRFVMPISKAVDLVLKAITQSIGGEIFILKMPALRINDLAKAMIDVYAPKFNYLPRNIKIKVIGLRDGEKFYEELISRHEAENAYETDDLFILIPPKMFEKYKEYQDTRNKYLRYKKASTKTYQSDTENLLSIKEIKKLLVDIERQL